MKPQELSLLEIYVMLSPFVVLAIALAVYWLTGLQDRREEERHHAAE